jgi:hypothetical protein
VLVATVTYAPVTELPVQLLSWLLVSVVEENTVSDWLVVRSSVVVVEVAVAVTVESPTTSLPVSVRVLLESAKVVVVTSRRWSTEVCVLVSWLVLVVVVVKSPVTLFPDRATSPVLVSVLVAETVSDWFVVVWYDVEVEAAAVVPA